MLNARQTRTELKKLIPNMYLNVKEEYRSYRDGQEVEECMIWVGTSGGILARGKTFEECLKKVEAEAEAELKTHHA